MSGGSMIECEDTISRKDALKALDYDIKSFEFKSGVGRHMNEIADLLNTIYEIQSDNIKALPPVQPKYNTDEWCKTCSEYNQDKHCCPRYNKVIRNAVEEMKQTCKDAISRESAQEGLTHLMDSDGFRDSVGYVQKTLVRKMLNNLPSVRPKQTECEDAISRKYAIDAVANLFEMSEYPHPYPQGKPIRLREIKEKLKQLPPVHPKIKTGHWISYWDEEARCHVYKCPECGNKQPFDTKCCWECGTRLVEPQESEE